MPYKYEVCPEYQTGHLNNITNTNLMIKRANNIEK